MSDGDAPPPIDKITPELRDILATAYAIAGGLAELNAITDPELGINILKDVTGEGVRMEIVINALCDLIESRRALLLPKAIVIFYEHLPGDERLRAWVQRNMPPDVRALVSEDAFAQARQAYAASRQTGQQELQQTAVEGFATLREATANSGVAAMVVEYRDKLTDARRRLQLMKWYKQLHDRLHEVQNQQFSRFGLMLLKKELQPEDLDEVKELVDALAAIASQIGGILQFLKLYQEPYDGKWATRFRDIIASLGDGVAVDRAALRRATSALRSILSLQLSLLNRAMAAAAQGIPFDSLAELLRQAALADADRADAFKAAATALDDTAFGLKKAMEIHDSWQDLDTRLWGFEIAYPAAVLDVGQRDDVRDSWTDLILPLVQTLEGADPGDWTAGIDAAQANLEAALGAEPPTLEALTRAFQAFAIALRLRFFAVDIALLNRCDGFIPLLPELDALTGAPPP